MAQYATRQVVPGPYRVRLRQLEMGNFGDCSRWARASSNYAYIPELAIASTAAGTARLSSCCCVAETKAARLATSRSPRRCGRNETEAGMSKLRARYLTTPRKSPNCERIANWPSNISRPPGIAGRPRRPGAGLLALRSRSLRWPGRRRGKPASAASPFTARCRPMAIPH